MKIETPEEMQARWAKELAAAGAATETQMHGTVVPPIKSLEDLDKYISSLTDRPHDYGTCCHAMSMASVAAFNYVASKLEVTGFQASCAQIDFLRRTRGWEWGQILDFDKLLYPQYCTDENFPAAQYLINKHRQSLAKKAEALLAGSKRSPVHPEVRAHWERLVMLGKGL